MEDHKLISKADLAKRWGRDARTIQKWIEEKKIKPFRGTNDFPLAYIEALETENIDDMESANIFVLRKKERRIEQLERENAELKATILKMVVIGNEKARDICQQAI